MQHQRRTFLKLSGGALSVAAVTLLPAGRAIAANRPENAFQSKAMADALKNLGATDMVESADIVITAPDIAENGAVVPIAVTSKIPNTESIAILAEKNPFPLAAAFSISSSMDAYVSTRVKLGQTSDIRAVIKAGGKYYTAIKEVKVTVGGCG